MSVAISVQGVSKTFKLPHEKQDSIKGLFVNLFGGNKTYERQQVLKNISFEIEKGEFFGIVGRNGSGKSTLLKLLAGIYEPNNGSIQVNGKLTPFIELGVGFNPNLTGRENVFLNGALLGFNRREMDSMYDEIVEFAEIERFMDQKLKNYSSGMQVRLAFSIAIRAQSDILLVDEVLAVGDATFQTKCFDYFQELKSKGTTVIFVSHDRASLERFCKTGILINGGELIVYGDMSKVLKQYSEIILDELENAKPLDKSGKKSLSVSEYVVIENVKSLDGQKNPKRKFGFGEDIAISFEARIKQNLNNPIFGVTIWRKDLDRPVFAENTFIEGKATGQFKEGEKAIFNVILPKLLNDGEYYIEPAIANESGTLVYDRQEKATSFFINGSKNPFSIISGEKQIELVKEK